MTRKNTRVICRLASFLLCFMMLLLPITGCSASYSEQADQKNYIAKASDSSVDYDYNEELDEDGSYSSKEDVCQYLITYEKLPSNFITKKEAKKLGWSGGSLEEYAPGKCIGGDRFGNYEGILPEVDGREYHECDIDTLGAKKRGAKRIVYSDDGQIYYTEDHYESFTLLYGDDE